MSLVSRLSLGSPGTLLTVLWVGTTQDGEGMGTGHEKDLGGSRKLEITLHLSLGMGIRMGRGIRVSALKPGGHTSST